MTVAKKTIKKDEKKTISKKNTKKTETDKKPAIKKTSVKKTTVKKSDSVEEFAVIQTGGKQYIVRPGETLKIEKITPPSGVKKTDTISFEEVLLVFDGKEAKIGTPYVKGAKVVAKIEGDVRAKKITVIRYKSKTRQFKKTIIIVIIIVIII